MKTTKSLFKTFLIVMILSFLSSSVSLAQETKGEESRLDSYNKLRKVIGTVEKYYVDELTLEQSVDKAIVGLLSNLDAHSAYLDEKKFKRFKLEMGNVVWGRNWDLIFPISALYEGRCE